VPAPRRYKADTWKPRILSATIRLIHEKGVTGLSLANIAKAAGTTAPTIIYYFGAKQDLIHEALKVADDEFWAWLDQEYERICDPVERLCLLFLGCVETDWDLPMDLWAYSLRNPELADSHREFDGRTRTTLATILADGIRTGSFADVPIDDVALRLSCLMDGLAVHVALADPDVGPLRMLNSLLAAASLELGCDIENLRTITKRLRTSRSLERLHNG
jgi:AcrR family transcriptional regulator